MPYDIPIELEHSVADLLDTLGIRHVLLERETIYYQDDPEMTHNMLLVHRDQPAVPAFLSLRPEYLPTLREMLEPYQRLVHLRAWQLSPHRRLDGDA